MRRLLECLTFSVKSIMITLPSCVKRCNGVRVSSKDFGMKMHEKVMKRCILSSGVE
jgi:hypothetical protein